MGPLRGGAQVDVCVLLDTRVKRGRRFSYNVDRRHVKVAAA